MNITCSVYYYAENRLKSDVKWLLIFIANSSKQCSLSKLQSGASYLSQGFEDNVLGSAPGRLADTAATYCAGRPSQLTWKNLTTSCDR